MINTPHTRRYLQGTLDYFCGIYCVINALSCLNSLNLQQGRQILAETILNISDNKLLLHRFLHNETDHYWVVAHMLSRYAGAKPYRTVWSQPFGEPWCPEQGRGKVFPPLLDMRANHLYLPEAPPTDNENTMQTQIWDTLAWWLAPNSVGSYTRVALFRFHRFLLGEKAPIVSHWTTGCQVQGQILSLFDASGETNAIHAIPGECLLETDRSMRQVRIVPESVILIKK